MISDNIYLSPHFGQATVFHHEVRNRNTKKNIIFQVFIEDPDEDFLTEPELVLIKDKAEWKYWVEEECFPEPYDGSYE